jgi:hypothetical protein
MTRQAKLVALVALSGVCMRQAFAQTGSCQALGGTCHQCLLKPGCDWCQLDGGCYQSGQHKCKPVDLRKTSSSGSSIAQVQQICANKCTSATCWLDHSHCVMTTKPGAPGIQAASQAECRCDAGFVAQGEAGHATLCAPPESGTRVVGRCVDAAQDPRECAPAELSNVFHGCASARGYANMASVCRASCGKYCEKQNCHAKDMSVDYGSFYCLEAKKLDCKDTTAFDYACPHHSIGQAVPSSCDDSSTARDDQCASEYTRWWEQCGINGKIHTTLGITGQLEQQLTGFYQKCKAILKTGPHKIQTAFKDQCNFETSAQALCKWTEAGHMAWTRSTSTPSSGTGPSKAHSGRWFWFLETSSGRTGDASYLISPRLRPGTNAMSFAYLMYGATINTLSVEQHKSSTWSTVWTKTGQQSASSTAWAQATVSLSGDQVRFKGTKGSSYTGDMAVDTVVFSGASAPVPPPPPPPKVLHNGCAASITHYVTFKGIRYATIENNPVDGADRGCQDSRFVPLPAGYSVASDTSDVRYNVIGKHKWSTDCPITASGNAYNSIDQGGGSTCGVNELKTKNSGGKVTYGIRPGCARRVFIQCRPNGH